MKAWLSRGRRYRLSLLHGKLAMAKQADKAWRTYIQRKLSEMLCLMVDLCVQGRPHRHIDVTATKTAAQNRQRRLRDRSPEQQTIERVWVRVSRRWQTVRTRVGCRLGPSLSAS